MFSFFQKKNYFTQKNMSESRNTKRAIGDESRAFQERWKYAYFYLC
jgi:hypothetical protein